MKRIFHNIVRILIVVALLCAALALGLAWVIRQPNIGTVAFPGTLHAEPRLLEEHVRFLALPDQPRSARNTAGLDRAAAYIAKAFARTEARCSEQPYRARNLETRNVIAAFGPDTGPKIIIGAHYDVAGDLPGADDNASGVAGILELARLLGHRHLDSTVEIVAYSTEEPSFFGGQDMGSAVHANALAQSKALVRAMICLEMIGYYTTSQPDRNAVFHLVYPRNGRFIALVGRWADRDLVREAKKCFRGASEVQAVSYSGPVWVGADLSDQRNYWARGYPAFMVTDTSFLRNPNYHNSGDTPETLDYVRMAGVVDGLLSTVVYLANGE